MWKVLADLKSQAGRCSAEHFDGDVSAGDFEAELSSFAAAAVCGEHGDTGGFE
jgi:hypothetical protein